LKAHWNRTTWVAAALVAGLALGACSGENGGAAPNAPDSPAATTETVAPVYFAGGDELAAGSGTAESDDSCRRGDDAYPHRVQEALEGDPALDWQACAGAKITEYSAPGAVFGPPEEGVADDQPLPTVVTLSLGGTEAKFAEIIRDCITEGEQSCDQARVDGAQATRAAATELATLYTQALAGNPQARVLAVGYPRLFEPEPSADCRIEAPLGEFADPKRQQQFNDAVDLLNRYTAAAVGQLKEALLPEAAARLTYVDVSEALEGHGVCFEGDRWVNGYVAGPDGLARSFQPNARGQEEIARRVVECYEGGRCDPVNPPYPIGRVVELGVTYQPSSQLAVTFDRYTTVKEGIKVELTYTNTSDRPLTLECPYGDNPLFPSFLLLSGTEKVFAGETSCTDRPGERWEVQPGESSQSWGVFPLSGPAGGQNFTVTWFGMGPTDDIMLWW
jgi:GDSL-like Lipase/Acylhydrolase family